MKADVEVHGSAFLRELHDHEFSVAPVPGQSFSVDGLPDFEEFNGIYVVKQIRIVPGEENCFRAVVEVCDKVVFDDERR